MGHKAAYHPESLHSSRETARFRGEFSSLQTLRKQSDGKRGYWSGSLVLPPTSWETEGKSWKVSVSLSARGTNGMDGPEVPFTA